MSANGTSQRFAGQKKLSVLMHLGDAMQLYEVMHGCAIVIVNPIGDSESCTVSLTVF